MTSTAPVPDGLTRWLDKVAPAAVAGSGGHNATFTVSCALWRMLDNEAAVWELLQEYNSSRCNPRWSEKELRHKLNEGNNATVDERRFIHGNERKRPQTLRGSSTADISSALAAPPKKYAAPVRPGTVMQNQTDKSQPKGSDYTQQASGASRQRENIPPSAEALGWLYPSEWVGSRYSPLVSAIGKLRDGHGAALTGKERKHLLSRIPKVLMRLFDQSHSDYEKARRIALEIRRTEKYLTNE